MSGCLDSSLDKVSAHFRYFFSSAVFDEIQDHESAAVSILAKHRSMQHFLVS